MRKAFTILAIASFALLACQKEATLVENQNKQDAVQSNIPTEIVCEIADAPTKTQYAGNTTFGWTQYDRIRMPVVKKNADEDITACDFYSFRTTSASGSVSATFILSGGSSDLETYNPNPTSAVNTWTNMGYLIYPMSIFEKKHSGDYPIVNLPSSLTYNASNPLNSQMNSEGNVITVGIPVPMIGRKDGETYKFSTAVGFLKVTINHFPETGTKIQLVSSENNIAGEFVVSDVSPTVAQIANTSTTASSTGTITINASGIAGDSDPEFYFPLPVGTYAADVLTVKVLDAFNHELISSTAKKPITIARNEILSLPAMAPNSIDFTINNSSYSATNPRIQWYMSTAAAIKMHISTSETNDPTAYNASNIWTASNSCLLTSLKSASSDAYITTTGKYYLHYIFVKNTSDAVTSLSDDVVKSYGTIPFYYITSGDAETFAGTYTTTGTVNNIGSSSKNLIIATSTNPARGNLMITTIYGRAYNGGDVANGTPVYGKYLSGGSTIEFTDAYTSGPHFHRNAGHLFYICESTAEGIAKDTTFGEKSNITFNITSGPALTCNNNLVLYYDVNKAFIWGSALEFSK